jgi:uncharacterized Zn finger protein (UPF0148 family)
MNSAARIVDLIVCRNCKFNVLVRDGHVVCRHCHAEYRVTVTQTKAPSAVGVLNPSIIKVATSPAP